MLLGDIPSRPFLFPRTLIYFWDSSCNMQSNVKEGSWSPREDHSQKKIKINNYNKIISNMSFNIDKVKLLQLHKFTQCRAYGLKKN